ncbi:DHA2 family efflux MFS transporter permease subunit [Actinomadura sp. 9N407]|uniref:DHA2 family efflux MFS transporter permease subunit n=1 Tax=Actinomadura sp. 9N407 TaxID=3375154 RepID=UPI0037B26FC4
MTDTRPRAGYLAIMLTASGGAFLSMLDSTVTNLAIPNVQGAFPSASVTDISWIITAYAVLFAALLAPSGKLADALGRRRLFVIGIGLFTLASLACALAPNLPFLIGARAVQGAGAAAMIPSSLAILLLDGPAERRAGSIGIWSAASAIGAAAGPIVGGVLVELSDWRAVFLINIPIGAVLIVSALRVLEPPGKASFDRIPDPLGTVLIALGIGALTLGVTEGGDWGRLDPRTLGTFAFGLAALAYTVLRSRTHPKPAIDTELWSNRTFTATNVTSLLYGMAQYTFMLVAILYMTDVWRYSELEAGLANTPGAVSASIIAVGLGRYAAKLGGPRFAVLFGLAVFLVTAIWLTVGLTEQASFLTLWLPASILTGIGMGAATMGTSASAAMSAPPAMFATSSGLNTTARQFGGALGIAAMAAILEQSSRSGSPTDPYSNVYLFCTVLLVLALAVAAIWIRLAPPPAAPAPATAAAKPAEPAEPAETT